MGFLLWSSFLLWPKFIAVWIQSTLCNMNGCLHGPHSNYFCVWVHIHTVHRCVHVHVCSCVCMSMWTFGTCVYNLEDNPKYCSSDAINLFLFYCLNICCLFNCVILGMVHAHMSTDTESRRGTGFPGVGVTGDYEQPDLGAGNWARVSTNIKIPNHWTTSPALPSGFGDRISHCSGACRLG